MKLTLPQFESAQVIVIGDIMLDRYWHGGTSRISPEAPVPVVKVNDIEERPGGAANVGLNIASLGARASLMGLTGDDEAANILQKKLSDKQVECHFQRIPNCPTITKLRVLSRHQQLIRLDFEEGFNNEKALEDLTQALSDSISGAGAIVLSDYAKGALEDVQALIQVAQKASVPVLVDPKGTDFSRYKGATLVTPNLTEFEAVAGPCPDDDTLVSKGMQLLLANNWQALLITRGEKGMTLIQQRQEPLHLPARAREVFDVTGAGDTVIGTLAAALAAGMDLPASTYLANVAASIVVGKLGTATVSLPELRRALMGETNSERGMVSEDELLLRVSDCRAHNEKVVMTNGCFDILHPGHVVYLEQAKALGDRLIVAVNDDDSVRRLKGDDRPINSLQDRMAVLAGLASVDWVVAFSEDTPQRLIERVSPDVLAKGGDYTVEQIAGAQHVLDEGGEVKIIEFQEGCSTSAIIKTIEQRASKESSS